MSRFNALVLACMIVSEDRSGGGLRVGCRVRVMFRMMQKRGRPLKSFDGTVTQMRRTSSSTYNRVDILFDDGDEINGFRLFHHAHGRRFEAGWTIL